MASISSTSYVGLKTRIASLGTRIENAASNDERLQLAIEAAELALRAIKLAASKLEQTEMRAKATSLLKQAETFKRENVPRVLPDRTRTPLANNQSSRSSSSLSNASTAVDRRAYRRQQALSANTGEPSSEHRSSKLLKSRRELSKAEQVLLLRGSKLNACKFPPWAATPNAHDFVLAEGSLPYMDDHQMRLSDEQLEYLDGWKHATEAIPPPTWLTGDDPVVPVSLERNLPNMDLVQDATTDCSVVASMCACIARSSKGHAKVLGELIYPWDNETGKPILSPNGKYIVKLNFNGCWRRVVIDDRLPVSKTKRLLHVVDRRNPQLLWPALLEKAYLKVRGGYDFPGSNSGTDLWMLTGWIPEQIFLQDSDTDLSETWRTILRGWRQGNALITMGTGVISRKVERADGLASQHDYAVLDLFDDGEYQLLQLKNPWKEGKSWTGRINGISGLNSLHESDQDPRPRECSQKLQDLLDEDLPPGTFWIPWNDVQQHFESIYCNWNPNMFSYREDIHFSWDLRTERGAVGSFANNPQFSIATSGPGNIWILLCRHFQDASTGDPGFEQNVNVDAAGSMKGHINLYLYDDGGRRHYISSLPCERGHYVDAPQVLCKASVDEAKAFTVVVSEQGLPDIRQNFSLTVFSKVPLELDFAKNAYAHTSTIDSAWTSSSAGGRSGSLAFYSNPMFTVQIDQPASLALLLSTPDSDLNVNLKLVHSSGKRILALKSRDLIADSGNYRRGSAFAKAKVVDAGTYTIICSTFEQNQKAPFTLRVDSTQAAVIRQLPPQYAGRLSKRLPQIRFDPGISRLGMWIRPLRHAIFSAAITGYTSSSKDCRTPIRLAIVINPGVNEQIMQMSNDGEYSDGRTDAVQLPEISIWPKPGIREDMWLMLERMSGGNSGKDGHDMEEVYAVDVYCDDKVDWCISMDGWRCFED